jgi:hypothetical protein
VGAPVVAGDEERELVELLVLVEPVKPLDPVGLCVAELREDPVVIGAALEDVGMDLELIVLLVLAAVDAQVAEEGRLATPFAAHSWFTY